LANLLQETHGISEENAQWAVNSWVFALGLDAEVAAAAAGG